MPTIGWLVGNNAGGWVVLGRAIGFHVAEMACCLVLAKSTENPEKRVLAMQREQQALLELQRFEQIAALERRIFEHAFAAFDQVEQQLGTPVPVRALPAAGQTSEAALLPGRSALLRRRSRRSFSRSMPAKPQKARGAAMGTTPFAADMKLPTATHAKLPKQQLNAEDRLRRLEEAKAFLCQHLTPEPMQARVLINDAKAAGIASRTLHRAKDVLGVQVQRQGWGQGGQWLWAAPSGQELLDTGTLLAAGRASRHTS